MRDLAGEDLIDEYSLRIFQATRGEVRASSTSGKA